ncbi:MAG TPA: RHS repeat-associated core domain-containing protein, partial [Polyangiaceae bacterium]|nr:RHS repeat-associated core domain-containing protein [Polyangiaceae bacterium]
NHVIERDDPAGNSTKIAYDEIGNVTSVTDPRGAATTYAYDTAGRLVTRTDPVQAAEQFTYDAVGHLATHVDRRGLTQSFAYDVLNRLTQITYADSTVAYGYDAQGNVSDIVDSSAGEYTFSYDVRNALTAMQGPSGALGYAYDLLGRVTTESILGQPDTVFSYNETGQYTRIETEGAGVGFDYDASGRLTTETRDNGVATHYTYDNVGALVGVRHELGGSDIDVQAYVHDGSIATTHAEGTALGALNTSEVTATYDLANRIQTWGSKTFTHDADGNRLGATDDSGSETYSWDARGRLTSITQANGAVIQLGYDYAGNLTHIGTADGDETLLNDASGNVVLRRTSDGTIQRMLSGLAMDHQVAMLDSKLGARYPLLTRPNSTVATVDDKGLVDGQYSYEPYGETSVTQTATADYPFLFTGRTRITDSLYYNRARYYDSVTSRFISEDPLGFGGGDLNLYGYVGGQPSDRVDPTGQKDGPVTYVLNNFSNNVMRNYSNMESQLDYYESKFHLNPFAVPPAGQVVIGVKRALEENLGAASTGSLSRLTAGQYAWRYAKYLASGRNGLLRPFGTPRAALLRGAADYVVGKVFFKLGLFFAAELGAIIDTAIGYFDQPDPVSQGPAPYCPAEGS